MTGLERQIAELGPWFHNLHLPNGLQTCPNHELGDFPNFKWRQLAGHLPEDLRGCTVLDIGCNAGFYSLELAKRGATVTALDSDPRYLAQARWAAEVFRLSQRISFEHRQVYDLARTRQRWDIVLFLGVLYHLRYPMLGLDIVSRCVRSTLVLQCLTVPGESIEHTPGDLPLTEREPLTRPGWPRLSFIEQRLAADPTNWWAPNRACIEAMLRSSGLVVTARPADEFYLCKPERDSELSMWTWNEAEYWAAVGGSADDGPGAG
jgi:tRNA (mo5U34)-methyltransferase